MAMKLASWFLKKNMKWFSAAVYEVKTTFSQFPVWFEVLGHNLVAPVGCKHSKSAKDEGILGPFP